VVARCFLAELLAKLAVIRNAFTNNLIDMLLCLSQCVCGLVCWVGFEGFLRVGELHACEAFGGNFVQMVECVRVYRVPAAHHVFEVVLFRVRVR